MLFLSNLLLIASIHILNEMLLIDWSTWLSSRSHSDMCWKPNCLTPHTLNVNTLNT